MKQKKQDFNEKFSEENHTIVESVAKTKMRFLIEGFPWAELEVVEMNEPKYALLKVSLKGFLDEIP